MTNETKKGKCALAALALLTLSGCLSFDLRPIPGGGVPIEHAGWTDGGYQRDEWLRREERRFYDPPPDRRRWLLDDLKELFD